MRESRLLDHPRGVLLGVRTVLCEHVEQLSTMNNLHDHPRAVRPATMEARHRGVSVNREVSVNKEVSVNREVSVIER